jgi:hypothetical protein
MVAVADIEPVTHRSPERKTDEEYEAFWRQREPIMAAQDAAARQLAPALVGLTVTEAQALIDRAEELGLRLRVEFLPSGGLVFGKRVYGRIMTSVRDGIVVAADAG